MRYEGDIFRPPSEAYSLLVQVTIGCSHNTCTFCSMFRNKKFRVRDVNEVIEDLVDARQRYRYVERIFLCDGDALCLSNDKLMLILKVVQKLFPECKRVNVYGNTIDVLAKTPEELKELYENGVKIVYLGAESGSDKILKAINKGSTSAEIIEAVKRLEVAGIKASVSMISGLGGKENWEEHAIESGRVITEMNASYVAMMTLRILPDAPMYKTVQQGELTLLEPTEVMQELYLMLKNSNPTGPTVFRSNHANNYYSLKGTLPEDQARLLATLEKVMKDKSLLKPEYLRGW